MKNRLLPLILCFLLLLCACGAKKEAPEETEEESKIAAQEETLPEEEPAPLIRTVSFIGCGDNIVYTGTNRDAKANAVPGGREYNFKRIYEYVAAPIANADIAFINQEVPMAGEGYPISSYPQFNCSQDMGLDLMELGFDVVNIANNHMLDTGTKGLQSTIDFWKSQDCLMIGGYENEEDFETVRLLEKNGITFAFLSYTYGTNGLRKAAGSDIVIPYIDEETIRRQVKTAREEADFVAVSIHWGDEGVFRANAEQERLAQAIADSGADVILGHHPHVIQKVEWLTGEGGNRTLCVYSLGNFINEQAHDFNMLGGMIAFDVVKIDDGKATLEDPVFYPTVCHFRSDFSDNRVYFLTDYTPELAAIHGVRTGYGNRLTYEGLCKYAFDTIDEAFLPVTLNDMREKKAS